MEPETHVENKAYHLFVSNMSTTINESGLRAMIAPFGAVTHVSVATATSADVTRSFGWVEMSDECAAARVVAELNGKSIDGCCLRVRLEN